MEDQVALFCAMRRYVGPDARISAQMFRRATSVISASATFKKSVYVLTPDQLALVRDRIPQQAILDPADLGLSYNLRGQDWVFVDQIVPREHLGLGVAEYVVAVKEKLMHSDMAMDSSASSSGAQQPQEAQPSFRKKLHRRCLLVA